MSEPQGSRTSGLIDNHVGARIRERRIMLGLTQQQLAEMIGVTYQQAHKYEYGTNRVTAARLYEMAQVLGAPVAYFYESVSDQRKTGSHPRTILEFARNFTAIQNEQHREALSQLVRILAGH